jgi:hypothetical protein
MSLSCALIALHRALVQCAFALPLPLAVVWHLTKSIYSPVDCSGSQLQACWYHIPFGSTDKICALSWLHPHVHILSDYLPTQKKVDTRAEAERARRRLRKSQKPPPKTKSLKEVKKTVRRKIKRGVVSCLFG